ncbi:TonB-dependent receptor [Fulvivirga ulvae]|uniref:TonB-dependent receptor plug domain-containing protein n=1 Tax=Fulvivirga ulvae TaxID=2904245 RepID=UPI001F2C4E7C|nr:TonB-dependent receptor [Fulvivirga ulvae]UII29603.1 TonB-dependent receptor [Fulvivirga ulvae]
MKNIYFLFALACLLTTGQAWAQQSDREELLNMSLEELMDIQVVNVSKVNLESLPEVPSAVTVISAEQIANSGAKNMEEILRNVPGFDVVRTGFDPSTNLGVRGLYSTEGTNDKILFMIDDHPVRSVIYGDATVFIGNYPVENIKQIEIIRGPGSTLFGAGAFLGVINIRTNQPKKNAGVSVSAGSFNRYNLNAQVTHNFGKDFNVTVLANYLTTDGPDPLLFSDLETEISETLARSLGYEESPSIAPGPLKYGRSTSQVNLNVDYKNFYLLTNYMNSDDEVPVGPAGSLVRESDVHSVAQYMEAGYRGSIQNDMGELLVKAYADHYEYGYDTELQPLEASRWHDYYLDLVIYPGPDEHPLSRGGIAPRRDRGASGRVLGAEVNYAYNFRSYVNFLAGIMYEHYNLTDIYTRANVNYMFGKTMTFDGYTSDWLESLGGMRDINDDYAWITENERHVYAGFGQADINLKNIFQTYGMDHFKLVAGVRYDHYSSVGGSLNPRLALLIAPDNHFYFKGLYGRAFRAPSFIELHSQNDIYINGDTELKPENVTTIEGVAGYRINTSLDVNVTLFKTKETDNIQPVTSTNLYTNIGKIQTSGVEAELRYAFGQGAYVMGSCTFQNVLDVSHNEFSPQYTQEGDSLYTVSTQKDFNPGKAPGVILNLTGNYPITRNINLNTSLNYLGERKRSQELAYELNNALVPTGRISVGDTRDPIPARTLWSASVILGNFDFIKGLSLQMTGYNLLDAKNYNPLYNVKKDDLLRAGRHWDVRLKYSF